MALDITLLADSVPSLPEVLKDAAQPIFGGAQVLLPILVLLVGIHKLVDHRTENHAVLLAEIFGLIIVSEGTMMALKRMIGI
ncbi:MAG: hypothetical protein ACREP9_03790 [Candidatus Dormibacteraceae bacterium]